MAKIVQYFFIFFSILSLFSCNPAKQTTPLNVMSFNIWRGGGKSVEATARVIVNSGADIVGIQEATRNGNNTAVYLADSLGWYSHAYSTSPAIISKYPIVGTSAHAYGAKIQIDEKRFVWMFNIHLMHCPYEPYQLNEIEYCGAPFLYSSEEAVNSALAARGEEVDRIVADILEARKEGYPVFLTGDFNEPSFLDWTAKAAESGLHKMAVEWPSTKAFVGKAGMKDSYRTYYPSEISHPGYTWTPLPETVKYEEVPDRIDFVFFSGERVELVNSQIVGEIGPQSDIEFENFPSDHRAVLSSFSLK